MILVTLQNPSCSTQAQYSKRAAYGIQGQRSNKAQLQTKALYVPASVSVSLSMSASVSDRLSASLSALTALVLTPCLSEHLCLSHSTAEMEKTPRGRCCVCNPRNCSSQRIVDAASVRLLVCNFPRADCMLNKPSSESMLLMRQRKKVLLRAGSESLICGCRNCWSSAHSARLHSLHSPPASSQPLCFLTFFYSISSIHSDGC